MSGMPWCARRYISGDGKRIARVVCIVTDASSVLFIIQPRRIAATSIAQRVAEEMGVDLGAEVTSFECGLAGT